jgi:hypothetical protein
MADPTRACSEMEPCSICGGVGSGCSCCQNCGAPHGRGPFGFCNRCAPFFDPHGPGCSCGDCPEDWLGQEMTLAIEPVSTAFLRIREAEVCAAGEPVIEPSACVIPSEGQVWRQTHDGVTSFALAAYGALRSRFRSASGAVVEAAEVFDHLGDRVLVTAIKVPGLCLLLSGATWGYVGTGPTGLAAILQDLGVFQDHDSAIRWVARHPIDEKWDLDCHGGCA